MAIPCSFLIFGHSFTRRQQVWCMEHQVHNLNFISDRNLLAWRWCCKIVLCKSRWSDVSIVPDLNINVTFLDIGSNGLCQLLYLTPLYNSQLRRECSVVALSEILPRLEHRCFSETVKATNHYISEHWSKHPKLKFWTHSRNNFNKRFLTDHVANESVHIESECGMARYYSSVHGACLMAGKDCKLTNVSRNC